MTPTPEAQAARQALHRDLVLLLRVTIGIGIVLLVAILAVGMVSDRRSCLRSNEVRQSHFAKATEEDREARYWSDHGRPQMAMISQDKASADRHARSLDCSLPLPDG